MSPRAPPLLAVLVLFLVPAAHALDELTIPYGGDSELSASFEFQDLYGLPVTEAPEAPASTPTTTAGGGGPNAPVKYYDVVLRLNDTSLRPGGVVSGSVFLDFVPESPPTKDGILTYTIISPTGDSFPLSQEVIKEGDHDRMISYPLPVDAIEGTWTLSVTWTVADLDPMTSTQSFTVSKPLPLPWPIIIVLSVFAVLLVGIGAVAVRRRNHA